MIQGSNCLCGPFVVARFGCSPPNTSRVGVRFTDGMQDASEQEGRRSVRQAALREARRQRAAQAEALPPPSTMLGPMPTEAQLLQKHRPLLSDDRTFLAFYRIPNDFALGIILGGHQDVSTRFFL